MAQLRLLLFVTVAGMVVVMTSVLPTVVFSACTCAPNQKEKVANWAEERFDQQRKEYCDEFGEKIASRVDVWPTILTNCIGSLVFNDSNPYLLRNFPKLSEGMNQAIKDIYNSCSSLVSSSSCSVSEDWQNLKNCSREIFMKKEEDVLSTSGQTDDDMLNNMHRFSVGTEWSIFECTAALL